MLLRPFRSGPAAAAFDWAAIDALAERSAAVRVLVDEVRDMATGGRAVDRECRGVQRLVVASNQ